MGKDTKVMKNSWLFVSQDHFYYVGHTVRPIGIISCKLLVFMFHNIY